MRRRDVPAFLLAGSVERALSELGPAVREIAGSARLDQPNARAIRASKFRMETTMFTANGLCRIDHPTDKIPKAISSVSKPPHELLGGADLAPSRSPIAFSSFASAIRMAKGEAS